MQAGDRMFLVKSVRKAAARMGLKKGKKSQGTAETASFESMSLGNTSPRSSVCESPRPSMDSVRSAAPRLVSRDPTRASENSYSHKPKEGTALSARPKTSLPPLRLTARHMASSQNADPQSTNSQMTPMASRPLSARSAMSPTPEHGVKFPSLSRPTSAKEDQPLPSARVVLSPRPPAPWPPHQGQASVQSGNKQETVQHPIAKDSVRNEPTGVKLTFKESGADTRIQDALLKILATEGVIPVIQEDCPAIAFQISIGATYAALTKNRLFNWGTCTLDETQPIDYVKENCGSFPYLASIALLRGKTRSLKALRDGIRGLEDIKEIAKRGVNRGVASELLKNPMIEMAKAAGHKYHAMLFSEKNGKRCVPGMCDTRVQLLEDWLEFAKKRVLQNKIELEAKVFAAETKKLLSRDFYSALTLQEGIQEEMDYPDLTRSDSDE